MLNGRTIQSFLRSAVTYLIVLAMIGTVGWSCLRAFTLSEELGKTQQALAVSQQIIEAQAKSRLDIVMTLSAKIERLEEKFHKDYTGELHDFESLAELYQFLAEDNTNLQYYEIPRWVCTHASFQLVDRAAEKGFKLYPMTIPFQRHMMVMAIVDDYLTIFKDPRKMVVMVEPLTDEVVIIGLLYEPDTWWKGWEEW